MGGIAANKHVVSQLDAWWSVSGIDHPGPGIAEAFAQFSGAGPEGEDVTLPAELQDVVLEPSTSEGVPAAVLSLFARPYTVARHHAVRRLQDPDGLLLAAALLAHNPDRTFAAAGLMIVPFVTRGAHLDLHDRLAALCLWSKPTDPGVWHHESFGPAPADDTPRSPSAPARSAAALWLDEQRHSATGAAWCELISRLKDRALLELAGRPT